MRMSDVQYSDDRNWWWDADAREWKPVAGAAASDAPSAAASSHGGTPSSAVSADNASDYFAQAMDAAEGQAAEDSA
jgi:hypothetical protein